MESRGQGRENRLPAGLTSADQLPPRIDAPARINYARIALVRQEPTSSAAQSPRSQAQPTSRATALSTRSSVAVKATRMCAEPAGP